VSKKLVAVLFMTLLIFAACGDDKPKSDAAGSGLGACPEVAPAEDVPALPDDFPLPDGVTLTGSTEAGPSTIIEGFFQADLAEAFAQYKQAFESAGYDVVKDEQEEKDAEVFFAGGGTTGQVNMIAECEGGTKLRITIRPD
jgi:hypothetical protein